MPHVTQPYPLMAPLSLERLRMVVAASGAGMLVIGLVLSPSFVRDTLLSSAALLDRRDVAVINSIRGIYAALGLLLLGLGLFWHRLFARLPVATTALFFVPIVGFAALVGSKLVFFGSDPAWYRWTTREDSLVEWATWAVYLPACWIAVGVAREYLRRGERLLGALYAVLAVTLFCVAMEEISWGQRVFGVQTPEAFRDNTQGELTVHNLPAVQQYLHGAYLTVGLLGGFAWLLTPLSRRIPLLAWTDAVTPPWTVASWFLPVAIVYAFYQLAPPLPGNDGQEFFGCFTWNDQELVELFLAAGFLAFLVHVRRRQRGLDGAA